MSMRSPGADSAQTRPAKRARCLIQRFGALLMIGLFVGAPGPAESATTGIAYDTLTIFGVSVDPAAYTQAAFESDYRAALAQVAMPAAVQPSDTVASRFYTTPSKQRTDLLASSMAVIVDCDARIVAILDLPAKKYYVRAFSDPFPMFPDPGGGGIQPITSKNSTDKYAVTVRARRLGARRIDGVDADGFETTSVMSLTGYPGSTSTATTYYSAFALPASRCPGFEPSDDRRQFYLWRWDPSVERIDTKYPDRANPNIRRSGAQLPDRLPLLSVLGYRGSPEESSTGVVTEVANIRRITSGDPLFTIPADFTPAGGADRAVVIPHVRKAETPGLAYDQVTKSGAVNAVQTFTAAAFKADFENAIRPVPRVEAFMRVYRTPTKSRTDDVKANAAWIVDCEANTATRIDFARKTFHTDAAVLGIGATPTPGPKPAPGPTMPAVDFSVSLSLESRALGTRRIADVDAAGYESINTVKMGGAGLGTSMESVTTSYYSAATLPALACQARLTELASYYVPNVSGSAGGFFDRMVPRPTATATGPPLPDRVPLVSVSRTTQGVPGGMGGSPVSVSETGHLRTISSDDPVFTIPPDFKPG
jgi:hypothetical protein